MFTVQCHPSTMHIEEKARAQFSKSKDDWSATIAKVNCKPKVDVIKKLMGDKLCHELSEMTGVSKPVVYKATKGKTISLQSAERIAGYFKLEVEEIAEVIL